MAYAASVNKKSAKVTNSYVLVDLLENTITQNASRSYIFARDNNVNQCLYSVTALTKILSCIRAQEYLSYLQ